MLKVLLERYTDDDRCVAWKNVLFLSYTETYIYRNSLIFLRASKMVDSVDIEIASIHKWLDIECVNLIS